MSRYYIDNKALEQAMFRFRESKREKVRYGYLMEDVKRAIETKSRRRKNAERETAALQSLMAMHTQTCLAYEEIQNLLATEFYTLSENIVRYAKFAIDSDDAVQEGVCICFEKIDRFDEAKGRAFNYLTTCILNHFRQIYRTARNYNDLRQKYYDYLQGQCSKQVIKNGREYQVYQGRPNGD